MTQAEAAKLDPARCAALFPRRFRRAQRYVREADRLACLAAGMLLHTCTPIREECLTQNPFGKPFSTAGELHFSISHGGGRVFLAVADTPVGIDTEPIGEDGRDLAPLVFTREEAAWSAGDPARFAVLWTRKESLLKAAGTGFSADPRSLCVLPGITPIPFAGKDRFCGTLLFGDAALSLCTDAPFSALTVVTCSADAKETGRIMYEKLL